MTEYISEKIIEDILSSDRSILAELLSINPSGLSIIARQRSLKSGKLDLLYLYESNLLLIELKAGSFYRDIIFQINSYYEDLKDLQKEHKLIRGDIRKIVFVTACKPEDIKICQKDSIQVVSYRPDQVLLKYFEHFRELSSFLNIQSGDYGVVRLGLIKSTLQLVSLGKNIKEICKTENRSEKTIRNRLAVAKLLSLVSRFRGDYFLTDFGTALLEVDDIKQPNDRLNEGQVELLSNFVLENPFFSSITYTLYAIIEAVFVLAKNIYPVPRDAVRDYFVASVGKGQTWRTEKARNTATYIFSNYACELNFLTKVGNHFYLNPKGIRAILLLQLNRSIKLIEAQK